MRSTTAAVAVDANGASAAVIRSEIEGPRRVERFGEDIAKVYAKRYQVGRVVRPEGLEPPTLWSEARCSIR